MNLSSQKLGRKLLFELVQANGEATLSLEKSVSIAIAAEQDRLIDVFVTYAGEFEPLAARGFRVQSERHKLAAGSVLLSDLATIASLENVVDIEMAGEIQLHLDIAVPEIHADQVRQGSPPYTGSGVIVGIIDTGLYIYQPGFNKANQTRILSYWDPDPTMQPASSLETVPAAPLNYGIEYTAAAINQALANPGLRQSVRIGDFIGHGSFVTQCAAGNGNSGLNSQPSKYIGVAPEADIVFVVLKPSPTGRTSYTPKALGDAISYIFTVAQNANKPAVINMSFGENLTPSDGTGPLDKIIDAALTDSMGNPLPGRAIVVSAGNEGNARRHSQQVFTANGLNSVTVMIESIGTQQDDTRGDNLDLWYTGTASLNITVTGPDPAKTSGPISPGNSSVGEFITILSLGPQSNGKCNIQIALKKGNTATAVQRGAWKISLQETAGQAGIFDLWINRKEDEVYAQTAGWNTSRENTVTSPATAASAISVGAYGTTDGGQTWRMLSSSSWGVNDVTGLQASQIKPTITAPGIVSAPAVGQLTAEGYGVKVNNKPVVWGSDPVSRLWGTSFSAPLVTGVVALMLQRNPQLGFQQIRDIIQSTARRDHVPTGIVLPNSSWGAGNIDALAAVNKVTP